MTLSNILNHHLNGGEFEYQSCDFESAKNEYIQTDEWKEMCRLNDSFCHVPLRLKDVRDISDNIKQKHLYWRKGKLRSVHFSPNGDIIKVFIGARYAISVYVYNTHRIKLI